MIEAYYFPCCWKNVENRLSWCLGNLDSKGFPDSSVGKESACNSGDAGSIPRCGRTAGEGIGYPLQYWASLVAQLVKNLPAMLKTWFPSLSWDDPLEKGKVTHCSILAWRIPQTLQSMGLQSQTRLSSFHFTWVADELTVCVCVYFWTLVFHSLYFSYAYSMILITKSWNKLV